MRRPSLAGWPSEEVIGSQCCRALQTCFLLLVSLCLIGQVVYDQHAATALSIFPQWLLLGSLWYLWRGDRSVQKNWNQGLLAFAILIPTLSCLTLLFAWHGWKANWSAIAGVIPISDAASYYESAQTFLREAYLDVSGQRRPLSTAMTSLWLYLSGDHFKLCLLLQALCFAAVAFLAAAAVAVLHGIRAGWVFFALLLVFAEPYLPTMMTESNGIIFGILALSMLLFGLNRGRFPFYCLGAFFLAIGLAIRPSALFVLPCVVIAGAVIFGGSRLRILGVAIVLSGVVSLPTGIAIAMNKTMGHGDGTLNDNLSYTIYGLVAGGKGWEQYHKENPHALDGLPAGERSRIVLQAARQHFADQPLDLARGILKGQIFGPLQSFAQLARLAFLGAAGDPLRLVAPAEITAVSVFFACILAVQWARRRRTVAPNRSWRVFFLWLLLGYLLSIPFYYRDGGLRVHAAVFPAIAYLLVWLLLPPGNAPPDSGADVRGERISASTLGFGLVLLMSLGWLILIHPKSSTFDRLPSAEGISDRTLLFLFNPGWPQADLSNFPPGGGDGRLRWFSGAMPDDEYRSAGIREISGHGYLYFGFDEATQIWKIIHTDRPIGLLNQIEVKSGRNQGKYRDFYTAERVQVITAR